MRARRARRARRATGSHFVHPLAPACRHLELILRSRGGGRNRVRGRVRGKQSICREYLELMFAFASACCLPGRMPMDGSLLLTLSHVCVCEFFRTQIQMMIDVCVSVYLSLISLSLSLSLSLSRARARALSRALSLACSRSLSSSLSFGPHPRASVGQCSESPPNDTFII